LITIHWWEILGDKMKIIMKSKMNAKKLFNLFLALSLILVTFGFDYGFKVPTAEASDQKSLITPSDLSWLGAWKTPTSFNSYSYPILGLRYVNGERRFLFYEWGGGVGVPGDIVEMKAPTNPTFYTGADMANASAMIETRRWAAADWASSWMDDSNNYAQGSTVGAIYWDEANGLLWFSVYGPYSAGMNTPTWGAVQLLDTVKSGIYRNVGSKYGPWFYVTTNITGNPATYARAVNQWIVPVPSDEQSLVNGAKFLIGAGHTGYNGDAPWGPDLHVLTNFSTSMSNPVPMIKQLTEYGPLSPLTRRGLRRDGSHYYSTFEPGSQNEVVNGEGTWYGGMSNVKGVVWVDTGTKHGVVMFGAEAQGGVGYWHNNPKGDEPYPTIMDPTYPICTECNGPKSTEHYLWLRIFDPNQFAEVFAGTRVPYADTYNGLPGMRTIFEVNMRQNVTNGANIPIYYSVYPGAAQPKVDGPDTDNGGAVWDPIAQQIIWMQYGTAPGASALSFFSVNSSGGGTPPPPPPTTKPGDLNNDNKVDIFDYNLLVGNFGRTGSGIQGDIDLNGKVDIFDYNLLVGNFGR